MKKLLFILTATALHLQAAEDKAHCFKTIFNASFEAVTKATPEKEVVYLECLKENRSSQNFIEQYYGSTHEYHTLLNGIHISGKKNEASFFSKESFHSSIKDAHIYFGDSTHQSDERAKILYNSLEMLFAYTVRLRKEEKEAKEARKKAEDNATRESLLQLIYGANPKQSQE